MKRHPTRWLLCILLLLLSGCVWLRLLEVKNQLADFDKNFKIAIDDGFFVVHQLNPVVLSDDFVYLTKLRASRIATQPTGYRWFLDFKMDDRPGEKAGKNAKVVSFSYTFNPENKLNAVGFSPLFLEIAPASFLEASIRSLAKGKIDEGKKQLKVDTEDMPKLTVHPPSRVNILAAMGEPHEKSIFEGMTIFKYKFTVQSVPIDPDYESRRLAEVKLFFDPKTDELAKFSGKFTGLKLSIDYRKLTGHPPESD